MKHMKKLSSLLLVLVLALALAVPALAADFAKFTEAAGNTTTHELFKVMDATLDGASLKDFTWPSGTSAQFDKAKFISGMQSLDVQSGPATNAATRAKELFSALPAGYTDDNIAEALDTLRREHPEHSGEVVADVLQDARTTTPPLALGSQLTPGYYMIKATFANGTTRNYLYNIQGTEGEIVIQDKGELPPTTPEVFKKVQDAAGNWVNAVDYPEGEVFQFQLSAPIKSYTPGNGVTHVMTFHDQMDASQLEVPTAVKGVYILRTNEDGTTVRADVSNFTFDKNQKDACVNKGTQCAFHVSLDAAAVKFPDGSGIQNGDMVYVEYESKLLPDANVGAAGNKNGVWVETPSGPSEIVEVTVYTFTLVADKVDGGNNNAPLPGATFQLSKQDAEGNWVAVGGKIGTPVHVDADGKPIDDQGNPVSEGGQLWYEITGEDGSVTLTTDGQTNFTFPKLDEGKYKLEEVDYPMTPDGKKYNQAGPYFFEVKATYNKDKDGNPVSLASITVTVQDKDGNPITQNKPIELGVGGDQGTVSTQVVNNTGLQMPETGGIGTTIFYIVGGVLAAGAVILLITKRRMSVEEE